MGSRFDRKRVNVERDRLSSLPDDLIHKILSFVSIKHAVQTSVLSSRWRFTWTSMPCLNFFSKDYRTLPKFSKFVTRVLSSRNNQVKVSSVKLSFRGKFTHPLVKRILKYAISHNVQQLNIASFQGETIETPLPVFSSQSLKNLTLSRCTYYKIAPTWDLPALTTLNLHHITLEDDNDKFTGVLSKCANLKNLTIKGWVINGGLNGLNICHPGLTSLTLDQNAYSSAKVVTPQLKNLTINNWRGIHLISAPSLSFLHYKHDDDDYLMRTSFLHYKHDNDLMQLSTELFHLEKADICIHRPSEDKEFTLKVFCLLRQLRSVKFLTLNFELVKLISSFAELISHQPSPFANLKSLKIYPTHVTPEEQTQPKVTMSPEVKNFLLDSSPGATFTMVSHEDIRAVMNVTSARNLMRELQELLDQWKESSEINTAHMESHMATVNEQGEVGNHMAHVESYWEDLNKQLEKGSKITSCTISVLRKIEAVLAKLCTSNRDELQARFSSLHAEAETMMDNMMDRMKIQCDKKPSCSTFFFHEVSTSS